MNTEIYYFSGTGNSLAVARDIAEKTDGRLIPIASVIGRESIKTDADVVGIVFPVYHGSTPFIISRFARKMDNLDGKYLFAVCTYGDSPSLAIEHLDKIIQSRGGRLAAGFAVNMPYNYIIPSFVLKEFAIPMVLREIPIEKQQAMFANWPTKLESIAEFVNVRKTGELETRANFEARLVDFFGIRDRLGKFGWLKMIAGYRGPTEMSFLESLQLMDWAFHYDEKCNGCGMCARICPVSNIQMADDKPAWQHHCEQCFACLQWCPQEAIQFREHTTNGKRYHHPAVTISDMLGQASKG
jgi:Pyruvate/2-oxoacid:ferredoxin oxidoreductase delta subunit/flavodoxin